MSSEMLVRINLLNKQLDEIKFDHLNVKSEFYKTYKTLFEENKVLVRKIDQIMAYRNVHTSKSINEIKDFDGIENEIKILEEEFKKLKLEFKEFIDSSTELEKKLKTIRVTAEKIELFKKDQELEKKSSKVNSAKLINEQSKLKRIEDSIRTQEKTKEILLTLLKQINLFEQTVLSSRSLSETKKPEFTELSQEVQEKIVEASELIQTALSKFDTNNITDFLIPAQKSYEITVECYLELNKTSLDIQEDSTFEEKVFTLLNNGLPLNTKKLNPVKTMIDKINKGVEISPLASFSNEVKAYYLYNLSIFKIVSNVP